jgi:hypothetical protein
MSISGFIKENTAKLALAASLFGFGGAAQAQNKPLVPDVKVDITGLIETKTQKLGAPKIDGVELELKTPINIKREDTSKAEAKVKEAMLQACDAKGMIGSLTGSITVQTVNGGKVSPVSSPVPCAAIKAEKLLR